ncbi:MAG: hypothetical protein UX49_C0004G0013 [Candidatus Wolfebacteria bacterium GW2011_GWC2_46_275]|uniref:Uncharacterized protein n=2 Tax=Candidatus Wolfeibacteriota TaxID=1752735 RepID=A0A0G1WGP5_9BACT|nr:MAG: hypothetical protein UX70_C0001G0556 [Candidatus Wolfebacteria bacterium GW2011_GWB1_47_1]KKU36994.1 MAG: hypothetical protein UX49_C0004G0013 [Candidatus Wolfebacteria bacterium GW2011_GWC2_46_275]KKU42512.1 MAG: hypothetical protein UX58_C0002G0226 [Candidatus Wolfebacteria bacterium GW2011_GWB2_46_69]KKU53889.1 MAG: hypothetical protein UX76_C0008G0012 [Candidatus Wolfebacteria bacterium GW2011_GWC1_47_103]KKU59665.1 MAG: hypothetical protein UX83_C0003G0080 [Candidatus Wolfebacteria
MIATQYANPHTQTPRTRMHVPIKLSHTLINSTRSIFLPPCVNFCDRLRLRINPPADLKEMLQTTTIALQKNTRKINNTTHDR